MKVTQLESRQSQVYNSRYEINKHNLIDGDEGLHYLRIKHLSRADFSFVPGIFAPVQMWAFVAGGEEEAPTRPHEGTLVLRCGSNWYKCAGFTFTPGRSTTR
jgi:hypothetical protein